MASKIDRKRLWLPPEAMRALGYRVVDHLVDRWAGLADATIPSTKDRSEMIARLNEPLPERGRPPEEVIDRAVHDVLHIAAPTGHPRFFGFIPSPSNFMAVLADALVAGFNPFGGNFVSAPGPHQLERVVMGWIRQACGFPDGADGHFVSGGSMANLTALAAARTAKNVAGQESRARVYVSDQTHASVAKGLRILGFPEEAIVSIPIDDAFRMRVGALIEQISRDRSNGFLPFAIVATAGTTNSGAIDPLEPIADVARERDLWLHVDGAYGVAARFTDRGKELLRGLERADSLSMDPHKWLFTPYECACVLVRDGRWLEKTFARQADYLDDVASEDREPDIQDQGVQLTRSLRALKLWMTFQVFGADGIARAIERGMAHAEAVQAQLEQMNGWELAADASLAICAFRFAPDGMSDEEADRLNSALVPRLVETGEAVVTSTVLAGRRFLRMCTNNPRTTDADIGRTLVRLDELAKSAAG